MLLRRKQLGEIKLLAQDSTAINSGSWDSDIPSLSNQRHFFLSSAWLRAYRFCTTSRMLTLHDLTLWTLVRYWLVCPVDGWGSERLINLLRSSQVSWCQTGSFTYVSARKSPWVFQTALWMSPVSLFCRQSLQRWSDPDRVEREWLQSALFLPPCPLLFMDLPLMAFPPLVKVRA
jgi:hypothetical protein